jgi:calcineurin-like phosphoesterase family protein
MTNKNKLYALQKEMKDSFTLIKENGPDMGFVMNHITKMSKAIDMLITEAVGPNHMFDNHMEMLGTVPDGYPRQQVSIVQHWRDLGRTIKAGSEVDLSQIDPKELMFWSDQHFGHKKIIEFSNRPFGNLEHMHMEMARRYKARTKPGQVVVWCGDVSFVGSIELHDIMKDYAHTYNVLVVGNHDIDRDGKLRSKLTEHFDEIHTSLVFGDYVITHHPWVNMLPQGMVNIHGHLHDRPFSMDRHLCACVELTQYEPVSLAELITKGERDTIKRNAPVDAPPRLPTDDEKEPPMSLEYYKSLAAQFVEPKK